MSVECVMRWTGGPHGTMGVLAYTEKRAEITATKDRREAIKKWMKYAPKV